MHHSGIEKQGMDWYRGGGRVQGTFAVLKGPSSFCGCLQGTKGKLGVPKREIWRSVDEAQQ